MLNKSFSVNTVAATRINIVLHFQQPYKIKTASIIILQARHYLHNINMEFPSAYIIIHLPGCGINLSIGPTKYQGENPKAK